MSKKIAHVTFMMDGTRIYELMEWAEGKVVKGTLDIVPVKHGGTDEQGQLKARPSARDVLMTFAQSNRIFTIKDVTAASKGYATPGGLYQAAMKLMDAGIIKRVGIGTYALTGGKKNAVAPTRGRPKKVAKKMKRAAPGSGIGDRVVAALRKMQNGSGEGVALSAIRKAVGVTNISPYISDLIRQKKVTRTAPSQYRAVAAAE